MNFQEAIGAFVLGKLNTENLPTVAAEAVRSNYDSPSLWELADSEGADPDHIRKLLFRALDELGIQAPSVETAAITAAKEIARDVVEGTITPYQGAKRIWSDLYTRYPTLQKLAPFVGFASEYEDDEAHRGEYDQMIVDECKLLLNSVDSGC